MLYFIGMGLGGIKDITLRGLEIIKKCEFLYLDGYTSIYTTSITKMSEFFDKNIKIADRELVESKSEEILSKAINNKVAFLVIGDPLAATTHTDLVLRAKQRGIKTKTVHNASIVNAVSSCGLQLYKFGQVVSIPFFTEKWRPASFFKKIEFNLSNGFHTLCLLDIRVKEQSYENLMLGNDIFEKPKFMKIKDCVEQILEVASEQKSSTISEDTKAIGIARLGQKDEVIKMATLANLKEIDFGKELHSLVFPGSLDEVENEFMATIK